MRTIGKLTQAQQVNGAGKADREIDQHEDVDPAGNTGRSLRYQAAPDQGMSQQTEYHPGHSAKESGAAHHELRHISHDRGNGYHPEQGQRTVDDFIAQMVLVASPTALLQGPGPDYPIVQQVEAGTVLLLEDEHEHWSYVRIPAAKTAGWLKKEHLLVLEQPH